MVFIFSEKRIQSALGILIISQPVFFFNDSVSFLCEKEECINCRKKGNL